MRAPHEETMATVWGWPEHVEKEARRGWLANSGYSFPLEEDMPWGAPGMATFTWEKTASRKDHTCRRDHADGIIKKGDRYSVYRYRYIDDYTGRSWHETEKQRLLPMVEK